MKKVLYFYPHKFDTLTDGIHTRIISFLHFFKDRGISIDMINFENLKIGKTYVECNNLVNSIHFVKKDSLRKLSYTSLLKQKALKVYDKLFVPSSLNTLPDLVNDSLLKKVILLCKRENYDAILITYAYWASILRNLDKNIFAGKKIIDTTDFLTLQQYYSDPKIDTQRIGNMFGSEINLMRQFDEIIHISYDELLLFSNFISNAKHHYIPQFFKKNNRNFELNVEYDILFVGSDNPYNIEGINWFFAEVYPLLDKKIKIAVAGNICRHINIKQDNVILLGFVEDVFSLYSISRCTICPLLKGSGIKIKVVESLSFGLPVISTLKGLDGFSNKVPHGGVLVANDSFEFANHIKRLLSYSNYYEEQCGFATEIFEEHFSIKKNFLKLDKIFN